MQEEVRKILQYLWEDITREGLLDTPKRVEKAYGKLFEGYNQKVEDVMTVFENESEGIDQIVGLNDIEFYSFCEHHMLPFFWKATVYYIPSDKICWISKLARIVNIFARRLQNQERLTKQIADAIEEYLHPKAIAVILEWKHFCMIARWVEKQNSIMKTSDLRWAFREDWKARQELFNLINK
jgi:GTP cyclohydrolase I